MNLTSALILGMLIFLGAMILYAKLPRLIKAFICKIDIIIDLLLSVGVYFALGQTVTALIASAFFGIAVSSSLWIKKLLRRFKSRPSWVEPETTFHI